MLNSAKSEKDLRDLLLAQLTTCSTLAGISLTLVGIISIKISNTNMETITDDAFLFTSMGFLINCYLIFFALRHIDSPAIHRLTYAIDTLFLGSLTLLVVTGFSVVYSYL
jgi:hypothetical protein